jgi:hypothetical protein
MIGRNRAFSSRLELNARLLKASEGEPNQQ